MEPVVLGVSTGPTDPTFWFRPMHPDHEDAAGADFTLVLNAAGEFARTRLGPASARLIAEPLAATLLLSHLRGGLPLEDAVLAEVHRGARTDRELANEFLAYFIPALQRLGHPLISKGLRRFLDTWDLSQSVLGGVWSQFDELEFTNRASFVALLHQRLRWKAAGRSRRAMASEAHEQAKGMEMEMEAIRATDSDASSPVANVSIKEDDERIVLVLLRMQPRDRDLLRMRLRGDSYEAMAPAFGLSVDSVRRAVSRALERARDLLGSGTEPTDPRAT